MTTTTLPPKNELQIDPATRKVIMPKRKRYHVGIVADGPAGSTHVAGLCFPKFTVTFGTPGSDGQREEYRRAGDYLHIPDEQVRAAIAGAKQRVVRWYRNEKGEKIRADIIAIDSRMYSPREGDELLIDYLYLREVPDEPEQIVKPGVQASVLDAMAPAPTGAQAKAQDVTAANAQAAVEMAARASEEAARADPLDAATREKHKRLKGAPPGSLGG